MKIELEAKELNKTPVVIETDIESDPDRRVEVLISSNFDFLEEELRKELENSRGHYGHGIDIKNTTNLDLQAAASTLHLNPNSKFKLVSITPSIIPNPNFPPEGAVS